MKTLAMLVLVMGVAGCAMTPAEVMETGDTVILSHPGSPAVTAECLGNHADNIEGSFIARSQKVEGATDTLRVVIRRMGDTGTTFAVVDLTPQGTGSRGLWKMSTKISVFATPESKIDRLRGKC